jgi:hypothetical protein
LCWGLFKEVCDNKIKLDMKKNTLLLAFTILFFPLMGQNVWNKSFEIPQGPSAAYLGYVRMDDQNFLISSADQLIALDWQGTNIGRVAANQPTSWYGNYVQKRVHPVSGKPFFLMGGRPMPNQPYTLFYFDPDETNTPFSLTVGSGDYGNFSTPGPALLELNETSLVIFTRTAVHKVACSGDTIWNVWTKPLNLAAASFPSAAVAMGSDMIVVTTKGEVSAVNSDGLQLWLKAHSDYNFKDIALVSDGLIACGATNGNAALVKMTFNGDLVWEKTFPDDLEFNTLTPTLDGNFALTGKSVSGDIPLLKITPNGDQLWRKSFQKGSGVTLLETPDAGFFLTGSGTQTGFCTIKTNADGETSAVDTRDLFRERNLNNGGFSLTQAPSSSLFFNHLNPVLSIPLDSLAQAFSTTNLWLGAKDAEGNLFTSADKHGGWFNNDFRTGIASSPAKDFNRIWSVTWEEIAQVRQDFNENGVLDAPPPFDFLTWPAKGNPHFQQNLDFSCVNTHPDSFPAPFTDVNGDGVYNVYDGDYPTIKGDRMLWWAITDSSFHHTTMAQALVVDISISVYAFDCTENQRVSQSIFVDFDLINRADINYLDTYIGHFTNPTLGCSDDDYFGFAPETNSIYVYNKDAVDGDDEGNCSGGVPTFGERIPVTSMTSLNQTFEQMTYANSPGTGPAGTIFPTTPLEFYNYLQGNWRDGTPLTMGGTGYNPNLPGATQTKYAFPDNPADPQGWSMCSANPPLSDRRIISSYGPFTFAAGDTFTTRLVFSYHPDVPHPCPDIDTWVKPSILQIQQWHDDGTLDARLDLGGVLTLTQGQPLVLDATQTNPATAYLWSNGQTTASISVTQPGTYTVSVTPATGCSYTETVLVQLASSTHSPALPRWTVQPNPASERLTILSGDTAGQLTVVLRNAQGKTVVTQNGTGDALEISVVNLPAGLYFAELWQEGQFLGSRKVVVGK